MSEISSTGAHSSGKAESGKGATRKRRCLVADSHTLMRQALCGLVETQPDLEVTCEAQSSDEVALLLSQEKPDVAVLDLGLRGDVVQLVRDIRMQTPEAQIVILAAHDDEPRLHACLDAGANAYVTKEAPAGVLFAEIRGGSSAGPTPDLGPVPGVRNNLTPREIDVMRLVAEGNPVKDVASTLGISTKTVETHKFNLMRKLNLRNTAQIVAYAIHNHIAVRGSGFRNAPR